MKKLRFLRWLLMAALAASLPISAQAAGGRGMGGGHFSGGRGFGFHDGRFHNRFFARGRVFNDRRFFARGRFGFVGFGFPYPYPYPYPYYCYPGPYWGY
jgi:hypothetical protein